VSVTVGYRLNLPRSVNPLLYTTDLSGADFATAGARLQLHHSIPIDRGIHQIDTTRGDAVQTIHPELPEALSRVSGGENPRINGGTSFHL
jgi:hypothetical protein